MLHCGIRADHAVYFPMMNDPIEQDLQPPQNVEIPDQLPLLPVRDIVVFPYMVLPLFVGRELSLIHI